MQENSESTSQATSTSTQSLHSYFIPGYPPLKSDDDVGRAAVEGQIFTYPKVVRKDFDPPITAQSYGNVSLMLFKEPKKTKSGHPIFGFMKLRGNHETEMVSYEGAKKIVREVDSKFQIRLAPVGHWVPITEDDKAVKEIYDVRSSDQEIHLRDEAVKEKESYARKIANELRENEKKLKDGADIYDNPESIDFYTMKRITDMRLTEAYQAAFRKIDEMQKKIGEQRIILKTLEKNHPEYTDQWVDVYNEQRKKSGLNYFIPGETQFEEYEHDTLESLLSKHPMPSDTAFGRIVTQVKENEKEEKAIMPLGMYDGDRDPVSLKSTAKNLTQGK